MRFNIGYDHYDTKDLTPIYTGRVVVGNNTHITGVWAYHHSLSPSLIVFVRRRAAGHTHWHKITTQAGMDSLIATMGLTKAAPALRAIRNGMTSVSGWTPKPQPT
ncbi:MAG: hypothetical protein GY832_31685 [Chloroflexi bacterium]|nr:hypothetical protein [Chloroflexota bacterium]